MMEDRLLQFAQESMSRGSRSFSAAARLLPREVRDYTTLLYAWCRHCDDAIDGQSGGGAMQRIEDVGGVVRELRAQTERAVFGRPEGLPFEALAAVVRDKRLDPGRIFDHLDGYEMDAQGRVFRTLEDTLEYSYHVAGTVGILMAQIMGVRRHASLRYAADLGIAFQLTNIARDVVEDANAGRCYLPMNWLDELGQTLEDLPAERSLAKSKRLALRLIEQAEPFYASAESGLSVLPKDCMWGISSALAVYRDIGRSVRLASPNQWAGRISTTPTRKLWLIGESYVACKLRRRRPILPIDRTAVWTHRALLTSDAVIHSRPDFDERASSLGVSRG